MAKFDKRLATILAKRGMVAEDSRDDFLAAAGGAGVSLTEYLVKEKGVGEGDIIAVHAGPPLAPPSGRLPLPDPEREVVTKGVIPGTQNLVIQLR